MNLHKNARLTPQGRAILIYPILEEGLRVDAVETVTPVRNGLLVL